LVKKKLSSTTKTITNLKPSLLLGKARAIIHNRDYASVDECITAIDRYFHDRNKHFKENPKKLGKEFGEKSEKRLFFVKAIIGKTLCTS